MTRPWSKRIWEPDVTTATETLLALRDVTVAYHGDITILNGVTLGVRQGQVTGIIGPNGAGKSTVLKTLFGFLRPRAGRVEFDGRDITSMRPHEGRPTGFPSCAKPQPVRRSDGRGQPAAGVFASAAIRRGCVVASRASMGASICRQAPRPGIQHERRLAALPRAGAGAVAGPAGDPARRADRDDRAQDLQGDLCADPAAGR